MKILFIAINAKYTHTNLAVRLLKNESEKSGAACGFVEHSINSDIEIVIQDVVSKKADAYCFSCYIWNITYILELTEKIKAKDSKTKILLGGPEVSFDSVELLENSPFIDFVIRNEGEKAIKDFSRFLLGQAPLSSCASLTYRKEGEVRRNEIEIGDSFLTAEFPYGDLETLQNRVVYYEASRGCPFACSFCLSSENERYREKPTSIVKRDLEIFIEAKVKIVKFVDRTFNTNKKRAIELIEFIMANSYSTCFHLELAPSLLNDELIDLLSKAKPGLFQLELGIQSTNKKTLKAINRDEDFLFFAPKIKHIINSKNMHVHVDLIAGLPFEGLSEFRKSFDDAFSLYSDNLQLGFLKLLKGSPLRKHADKFGIEFDDNAPYEVIQTSSLSKADIACLKEIEYLLKRIYNSSLFVNTSKLFVQKFGSALDMFIELNEFCKGNNIDVKKIDEIGLVGVLWDFAENRNLSITKELILFESLKKRKRPALPSHIFGQERWDFKEAYFKKHGIKKADRKGIFPIEFKIDIFHYTGSGTIVKRNNILIFDYREFEKGVRIYRG